MRQWNLHPLVSIGLHLLLWDTQTINCQIIPNFLSNATVTQFRLLECSALTRTLPTSNLPLHGSDQAQTQCRHSMYLLKIIY